MNGPHDPHPVRWLVLSMAAPPRGEEFLVVDALRRLGARAVAQEGERVLAWLPAPRHVPALLRRAEATLRSVFRAELHLDWQWQSHHAWAERWVEAVEPRRVTDRIVVAPAGRHVDHGGDDVVIRLEPGMAFGTAEHATTRGCLQLLETLLRPGDNVVDIGTGSGILAIAAALLGARRVLALEADPLACHTARRNAAANGVAERVDVRCMQAGPADVAALPPQQLILANLEMAALAKLLPALSNSLADGGFLVVAGMTGGERRAFFSSADAAGLDVLGQRDVDGWLSAALRRRS